MDLEEEAKSQELSIGGMKQKRNSMKLKKKQRNKVNEHDDYITRRRKKQLDRNNKWTRIAFKFEKYQTKK